MNENPNPKSFRFPGTDSVIDLSRLAAVLQTRELDGGSVRVDLLFIDRERYSIDMGKRQCEALADALETYLTER